MECVGMEWHRSSLETNNTDVLLLHFLEIPCLKFLERDLICDFNLISDTVLGTQERALVEGLLEQYNSWRRPVTSSSSEATLVNISIRLVQIFEMVWCAQMCGHIITVTKMPIVSSASQIAISKTSRKRPPPISDHLTKIPIGSSVSQIAISETSRKRPPPISEHLTPIGSRLVPLLPVSDHLSLTSRVVAHGRFHYCISNI